MELAVDPHPVFDRRGDDLVCSVDVPMTVAALGGSVPLKTLDGNETVEIEAGTQSGAVKRFRKRGVPHPDGRGRGDLLVQIAVVTPTHLGEQQRALIRQLAQLRGEEVDPQGGGLFARLKGSGRGRGRRRAALPQPGGPLGPAGHDPRVGRRLPRHHRRQRRPADHRRGPDAGIASLQWVVNAYTLTLSGFLLLGGSLGDHYGRRRVFVIGVVWFAAASLLCGLAPTDEALIAARAFQGVGGALLTPGSLAIIEASFAREDRGPAIGAWSGLGGVAAALGPFLGGWLVQAATWRLVFLINLPWPRWSSGCRCATCPKSRDPGATGRLDWAGPPPAPWGWPGSSTPSPTGLPPAGPRPGSSPPGWWARPPWSPSCSGSGTPSPMLPLDIFASRQFSAANAVTFVVYGALGESLFLMPIQLQRVVGWSPLASGVALVPVTLIMLLLSARSGRLASGSGRGCP